MNDIEIINNINNNYNLIKNNQVILQNKKNINNNDINLLLDIKKTLIIENCDNINITIPKITQILIIKSKNVVINYNKPVIGIFISNSKSIKLNENISSTTNITFEFYNSHYINVNNHNNNNIFLIIYCIEIFINNISIFLNFFNSCCLIIDNNITYF